MVASLDDSSVSGPWIDRTACHVHATADERAENAVMRENWETSNAGYVAGDDDDYHDN